MFKKTVPFYLTLSIVLAGCQNPETESNSEIQSKQLFSAKQPKTSDYVAYMDQRGIERDTFTVFKQLMQENYPDRTFTDEELLNQLIDLEIWAQEARKKSLQDIPANKIRVKLLSKQFYAERAKEFLNQTKLVGNEQIKAEYDLRYSPENRQQVKLQTIEQASREDIEETLASLKMGADFPELARLTNPNSDNLTGESEWINVSALSPDLASVVLSLEKGRFNEEPLATENGWQLVLVENIRTAPAPELNEVRDMIAADLQQRQIAIRTRVLREAANIRYVESGKTETETIEQPETPAAPMTETTDQQPQAPEPAEPESDQSKSEETEILPENKLLIDEKSTD